MTNVALSVHIDVSSLLADVGPAQRRSYPGPAGDRAQAEIQVKLQSRFLLDQLESLGHGPVEVADKGPPVGQRPTLEGQVIPRARQILHPVNEPGQAVPIPAVAAQPLLLTALGPPIFEIGPDRGWIGPIVIPPPVGRIVGPAAAAFARPAHEFVPEQVRIDMAQHRLNLVHVIFHRLGRSPAVVVMIYCVGLGQHRQIVWVPVAVADVAVRPGHVRFPDIDHAAVVAPQPDLFDPPLFYPMPDIDPLHYRLVICQRDPVSLFAERGQRLLKLQAFDNLVTQAGLGRRVFVAVVNAARFQRPDHPLGRLPGMAPKLGQRRADVAGNGWVEAAVLDREITDDQNRDTVHVVRITGGPSGSIAERLDSPGR